MAGAFIAKRRASGGLGYALPVADALTSSFFLYIGNRYSKTYKHKGNQVVELPDVFSSYEPTEYGGK